MKAKEYLVKNITTVVAVVATVISLTTFSTIISKSVSEHIIPVVIGVVVSVLSNFLYDYLAKSEKSVFIVYNHKDYKIVQLIAKHLRENKHNVLLDTEFIKPGENINDKINISIKKANKIIVVLSKDSANSKWVDAEIKRVLELQKNILPIVVTEDFTMPEGMKDIKYADLTNYDEEKIEKFVSSLN